MSEPVTDTPEPETPPEPSVKMVTRRLHGVAFKMPLPFASGAPVDDLGRAILDRTLLSTRLKAIRAQIKEQQESGKINGEEIPEATVIGLAKWAADNVGLPLPPARGRAPRTPEQELEDTKVKLAAAFCRQLIQQEGNDPAEYDIKAEVAKLFAEVKGAEKHYETQARIQLGRTAPAFADLAKEMLAKATPKAEPAEHSA